MSTVLSTHFANFNGTSIQIIDHNGQQWLTAEQIGKVLGLRHPRKAISKIFNRHKTEITKAGVTGTNLGTVQGNREMTIFSPRAARTIAFFCQTETAQQFREWVLDQLESNHHPHLDSHQLAENMAVQRDRIADLSKTITNLQKLAVKVNPEWAQIKRYKEMGLNNREIALLLGLCPGTIGKKCREMEAASLITPPANLARMQQHALFLQNNAQQEAKS